MLSIADACPYAHAFVRRSESNDDHNGFVAVPLVHSFVLVQPILSPDSYLPKSLAHSQNSLPNPQVT